jgi:hypothetical protein
MRKYMWHHCQNVYYYYYKLQLSCHSVAGQTKHVRKLIHQRNNAKNTVQTIQNTVNLSTRITKINTHMIQVRFYFAWYWSWARNKAEGDSRRAHVDFTSDSYFNLRILHFLPTFIYLLLLGPSRIRQNFKIPRCWKLYVTFVYILVESNLCS